MSNPILFFSDRRSPPAVIEKLPQFLIPQENLEEIGYQNTLEEAAVGFDVFEMADYLEYEFKRQIK